MLKLQVSKLFADYCKNSNSIHAETLHEQWCLIAQETMNGHYGSKVLTL